MKQKLYKGHFLEEVEKLAVTDLGVCKDDMYFDVLSDEGTPEEEFEINVMVDANPVKKAKDFIESYLKNAGIDGYVERKMRDNVVEFDIKTIEDKDNAILIGKAANTLKSLQFVLSHIVNLYFDKEEETGIIVKVDIGGYRKTKDEKLEKLATRIARDVVRSKMPIQLRYMNSYERKIVHDKLSTWRDVVTKSEGVEPNRFLIVSPRKK